MVKRKSVILCLFIGLCCLCYYAQTVLFCTAVEHHTVEKPMTGRNKISEFAETLKVFPVDLIAGQRGPLTGKGAGWGKRYELTFEHYRRFYEFKEFALTISERDFVEYTKKFETATSREKSLIMTLVFIYERVHRKRISPQISETVTITDKYFLPQSKEVSIISDHQWNEWISLIKLHTDDTAIVFQPLEIDEMTLKNSWEADKKQTIIRLQKLLMSSGLHRNIDTSSLENPLLCSIIIEDAKNNVDSFQSKQLDMFGEFLSWQYFQVGRSGLTPTDGNSSATPKTLGDIATQLLMSRLPYEGNNK